MRAFQTYARSWRKMEPEELEPSDQRGRQEQPQRFQRLCYYSLAEKYISFSKASELLNISWVPFPESVVTSVLVGAMSVEVVRAIRVRNVLSLNPQG